MFTNLKNNFFQKKIPEIIDKLPEKKKIVNKKSNLFMWVSKDFPIKFKVNFLLKYISNLILKTGFFYNFQNFW